MNHKTHRNVLHSPFFINVFLRLKNMDVKYLYKCVVYREQSTDPFLSQNPPMCVY